MTAPTSRDRKLLVDGDVVLPEFSGTPMAERTTAAAYHDTSDLRLLRAGIVLCRREREDDARWQLKMPRKHHGLRLEAPAGDDVPPGELADLLAAHTRGEELRRVASLRTTRWGTTVQDGDVHVADVEVTRVDVLEGDEITATVGDIEITPVDGSKAAVDEVEQRLREAGARDPDPRTRVQRALDLAPRPGPARDDALSPGRRLRAMVADQYRAILTYDPGTRLGQDPEHLHQHRVAVRKLRSVLRAARPMLDPEWTLELREELGWAGRGLGEVRDLDVLIEHLDAELTELPGDGPVDGQPLLDALHREREAARGRMLEELSSDRYLQLIERLSEAAEELPVVHEHASLVELARSEYRKVRKAVKRLGPLPTDADLHEARIKVKRLRYTAETAADVDGADLRPLIKQTKRLQTLLGDHQDAHVAEERLHGLLETDLPIAARIAGNRLIERERIRRRQIRKALPAEWKELRRGARNVF